MNFKITTKEIYQKQMNIVIEYINNHLHETIDLSKLAEMSHFSLYHFHRITKAFLKEPIGSYIIRIRLEKAARLLRYTDLPISDIGYKVGYDIPSSFSKAFKQLYKITPLEFRKNKDYIVEKKDKENIDILLDIDKPKIVEIPAKKVIYISLSGKYSELDFSNTWKRLWKFVKSNKLYSGEIENICIYYDDPKITYLEKLRTDVCLVILDDVKPQGEIGVKEIKGGKFAKFLYKGSYKYFRDVYNTIYADLIPANNLLLRDAPIFEKYINHPGRVVPEKLKTEIYIPIC